MSSAIRVRTSRAGATTTERSYGVKRPRGAGAGARHRLRGLIDSELVMDGDGADRFGAFVNALAEVVGHADRVRPLRDYCMGLLTPAERKSVEPLAAVTAPSRVSAQHQSLYAFRGPVGLVRREGPREGPGADASLNYRQGADRGLDHRRHELSKAGPSTRRAVARQYSGQLGKQDNCQVAVSLSLANAGASFPIAYRLYLPKDWAADPARRKKAGVPEEVTFRTKPEIALDQIRAALEAGAPPGVVLMDAGYGADTSRRFGARGARSCLRRRRPAAHLRGTRANPSPAVRPWSGAWAPDEPHGPRRRPPAPVRRGSRAFASGRGWEMISWREGSADLLISRFARLRVRAAHRDFDRSVHP